jgi:hypothetical protein
MNPYQKEKEMIPYTDQIGESYLDRAFNVMQRNDSLSRMKSDDEKIRAAWYHLKNAAPYCTNGYLRKRFLRFYTDYAALIEGSTICIEMMELRRFY